MNQYLRDLIRRKDLLAYLTTSGLKAQHRNSILGYFWWLLDPLIGVLIYYFIVVIVFDRSDGPDYGLYLVIGMIVWRWLSSTFQAASKSRSRVVSGDNMFSFGRPGVGKRKYA